MLVLLATGDARLFVSSTSRDTFTVLGLYLLDFQQCKLLANEEAVADLLELSFYQIGFSGCEKVVYFELINL